MVAEIENREALLKCYMSLCSAIIQQANKDTNKIVRKNPKRATTGIYISRKDYADAVNFLGSEYCEQMKVAIQTYNQIKGENLPCLTKKIQITESQI